MMQCSNVPGLFSLFFMLVYIGVIVYFVLLGGRLVRAVERIADRVEGPGNSQAGGQIVNS